MTSSTDNHQNELDSETEFRGHQWNWSFDHLLHGPFQHIVFHNTERSGIQLLSEYFRKNGWKERGLSYN